MPGQKAATSSPCQGIFFSPRVCKKMLAGYAKTKDSGVFLMKLLGYAFFSTAMSMRVRPPSASQPIRHEHNNSHCSRRRLGVIMIRNQEEMSA